MSEKSPASKLVSTARRVDEVVKIAGGGSGGLEAALPDVLEELQNTLHELVIAGERLRLPNEELSATLRVLEAKQARYQRLFDFAPGGYLVTAPDGMIEEVNQAAASLLGAPKDHLVGKPLVSYVSEADRREFLAHLKRIPELGRGHEARYRKIQMRYEFLLARVELRDSCNFKHCTSDLYWNSVTRRASFAVTHFRPGGLLQP